MIDFELTDAQRNIQQFLHWVAESEIRPISLQADEAHEIPMSLFRKLKELGVTMDALPGPTSEPSGAAGDGERPRERQGNRLGVIAAEELAWGDAAVAISLPGAGLGGPPVQMMGTPEQKERFLGIFKDPEPRWGAYALTEPEAGSDVSAIRTTCRKEGDHWVLNGTKLFITNGARASWNVVFATVDPSLGRAGHRVFVVEKDTPGFTVGRLMDKMGLRASETAELLFQECRVPAENLLGGEERYAQREGFKAAMQTFDVTRPTVAAMAVGIGRAAFEYTRDRLREELNLNRPIPRYGVIAERLSRMERELHAARLLVWQAASMADQRIPNTKEASMAKAYAGTVATRACADAVELLGAAGIRHDRWVEKWYRDIKVFDIFEGTGQVQRLVVARRLFEPHGLRV